MQHTVGRSWPVIVGIVILALFVRLETQQPPVIRSSFTLVGIIDCGQRSGRACAPSETLTLISDDSGAKMPYVINLSWLKDKLSDSFEQDQQVRIEIERLPDGTLMALRIIELANRQGTQRDDEGPRPSSSDQSKDDDDDEIVTIQGQETTTTTATSTICIPATATSVGRTTTTQTSTTDTTLTTTETTTATITSTTATTTTSFFTPASVTETVTSTTTIFPCGTTTTLTSTTATDNTTTTNTVTTTTTTGTTQTTVTTATTTTTQEICRVPLGTAGDEDAVNACTGPSSPAPWWVEAAAPSWQAVADAPADWWARLAGAGNPDSAVSPQ